MDLSIKLKEAREKAGYSQKEVSEKLNVSRQSVSRWENGWLSKKECLWHEYPWSFY